MKLKFLLFIGIVLLFTACNQTNSVEENFFSRPTALLYSSSVSNEIWVVDKGKMRYALFSPDQDKFMDLVKGDGFSGIAFPSGFDYVAGASGADGVVAVYSNGDTEEVLFHPTVGYPFEKSLPSPRKLSILPPQKIFYDRGKWGFLYGNKIVFYSNFFTYETEITLPVNGVWRKVVAADDKILLIPYLRKNVYDVSITNGSSEIISLDFLPSDGVISKKSIFLVGGGYLYYSDLVTGWKVERKMNMLFSYAGGGEGNVFSIYEGKFFGVLSGKGSLYLIKPDLCFISREKPTVENQYFVDAGNQSNPQLTVGDFSSCIGDVPDDTFTLYFGAPVQGGEGYVVDVTSAHCFSTNALIRWEQVRSGDEVVISGNHYFKTFTLTGGEGKSICVKEGIDKTIKGMKFTIKMNGYALYSRKEGYIGRLGRNGKLNLGYATLTVKDGDKPVTIDDYFVFTLSSGLDPIFVDESAYIYSTNTLLFSFPAGLIIRGEKAYLLYEYSPLFAVISLESGETLTQVR